MTNHCPTSHLQRPTQHQLCRLPMLLLMLLLVTATGCFATRPAKVCMQGNLTANGTIKTVLATDNNVPGLQTRTLPGQSRCLPKIALIDVDGLMVNRNLTGSGSLGENPVALLREKLDAAAKDDGICAVVLRINSPGGGVTASDIMHRDLQLFRQRNGKPVVACLMDLGAGGAYYLASASDVIVAHPTTLTGGLGVILNLYDVTDTMAQQNVFAQAIRSGEKVDMGSPVREMEEAEQQILQNIAREYHARLRNTVIASRPDLRRQLAETLPQPGEPVPAADAPSVDTQDRVAAAESTSSDTVSDEQIDGTIFDGRVIVATEAMQLGLVDQLGYLDDAIATARGLAGLTASRTVVFRRNTDRALTAYDITPNLPTPTVSVPLSIPGLDRSQLPVFLYLWQPEPLIERTGGL